LGDPVTPPAERARVRAAVKSGPFGRKNTPNTRFPNPPQETYGFKNAKRFFEYWCAIPEPLQDLIEVRVYRTWPQVKMELVEPERRDHCWEMIAGKCPFDPENYENQVMMRDGFGSGDYRFDLKEAGTQGVLTKSYVRAQDLQMFPPVIDYSTLVNCPANQEYIRGLMKRNIKLPWEYTAEEENDMAGTGMGEAMNTMAKAVTDIAKTAVETAHQVADAKVEAAEARQAEAEEAGDDAEEIEESAVARSMDLLAHAAEKSMDMMTRHAGKQYDPVEMLKAAKELMGNDGTGTQLLVSALKDQSERMLQMQEKNLEFMRERLQGPVAAVPTDPFALMLEKGSQIKQMADLFGWGPRDRDDEPLPPPPAPRAPEKSMGQMVTENIVPIVSGLSMILTMGANILYNMKASAPRNPAEDLAAAAKLNPLNQMGQVPGGMPGMPPMPGMPNGAMPPGPADPLARFRALIPQIESAFLQHFFGGDQDFDGYSFAEWVLSNKTGAGPTPEGRQAYGTIKETLGRSGLDQLIREYPGSGDGPSLWHRIQGMPAQYSKFLDEFFSYDEWVKQQPVESEKAVA
jgi:hypothetical protein